MLLRSFDPRRLGPAIFLVVAMLAALNAGCSPSEEYVRADRATYDAIAPEYISLAETAVAPVPESPPCATCGQHPVKRRFDDEQLDRRRRTVGTWKLRLDKAGN